MSNSSGGKIIAPYWAMGGSESWSATDSCKMFLPCDEVSDGAISEKVTGGIIESDQYALQFDSTLNAVHSTMPVGATGYFPAPSMTQLDAGKYSLMMYAGYLHFVDGDPDAGGGGRFSMGAGGTFGDGRFSLANAHSLLSDSTSESGSMITSTWDITTFPATTETDEINSAVGVGGFFYKIGLYNPSTGVLSTSIRNGTTGAEIAAYANSESVIFGNITFNPALRFGGLKLVGAARFDFTSLPSNYLTLAFYQIAEWKRGNRIVLKQWDY